MSGIISDNVGRASGLVKAASGGGIVSTGNFSDGRNVFTHTFDDQLSSTSTSLVDVTGSELNCGAGALTANKTCIFNYSIAMFMQDWVHGTLLVQYSVDDGSNYIYGSHANSEDRHDFSHELASTTNTDFRHTSNTKFR
jgi:hypothetical protein